MTKQSNVYTGTVTKVVHGETEKIVTISLDHGEGIELTVSFTPVPSTGQHPADAVAQPATAQPDCAQEGSKVKVVVPVPAAFLIPGN
ncbi:MAG TPA: hypothetical protein VKS60_18815 [Stellaceae bacterium]|nr:hypothetical protein [Stellaceae bacterium]